jgi:hypothetical protein
MYPTNKLPLVVRLLLAVIVALLSSLMFVGLMVGALKIAEWVVR